MKYARTCILSSSERLDILFFDVAALRRLLAGGMPVGQARAQAIARHVPPSVWNHELKLARMGDTSRLGRVIMLKPTDLTLDVFSVTIRGVGRFQLASGCPLPAGLDFDWAVLSDTTLTLYQAASSAASASSALG